MATLQECVLENISLEHSVSTYIELLLEIKEEYNKKLINWQT